MLRLSVNGKRRDMGLSNLSFVKLSDARDLSHQYNSLTKSVMDPIHEKLKLISVILNIVLCLTNLICQTYTI